MAKQLAVLPVKIAANRQAFPSRNLEGKKRMKTTGTKPELILRILSFLGLAAPSDPPVSPSLLFAVSAQAFILKLKSLP